MFKSFITLLVLATLAALCTARNLLYFQPGSCNRNRDHVGCYNQGGFYCCWASSPWCGSGACDNCIPSSDLLTGYYDVTHRSCAPIDRYVMCSEPDAEAGCCIDLQSRDFCQMNIFAFRKERALEAADQACAMVEPNKMAFTDASGVQHEIHMPKGTFDIANTHYQQGNWTELKKFSVWANQSYDESDIIQDDEIVGRGVSKRGDVPAPKPGIPRPPKTLHKRNDIDDASFAAIEAEDLGTLRKRNDIDDASFATIEGEDLPKRDDPQDPIGHGPWLP